MYQDFYHLSEMPFQLTPDARFFYGSRGHDRAISHLIYGLAQREGFIVVTGEVGAGKTMLVEWLRSKLDTDKYTLARIGTTRLNGDDLLRLTAAAFGLKDETTDKATLLGRLERIFRQTNAAGKRCLLIVDEAQGLPLGALEELRMLSNFTEDRHPLLQTILLGQPQFRELLASPELDQFRQRVLAAYHLGPLTEIETRAYIEHRLKTVGWTGNPSWTEAAFAHVHRHSDGIPRRVNRLCSRILLYGALEGAPAISEDMVEQAATELEHDLEGPAGPSSVPAGAYAPRQDDSDLARRVALLEAQVGKREQSFRWLVKLLGDYLDRTN